MYNRRRAGVVCGMVLTFPSYKGVNTLERELLWDVIGTARMPRGHPSPFFVTADSKRLNVLSPVFCNCRF